MYLGHERGLLGALSGGVQLRVGSLRPPKSVGLCIHQVINLFFLLHSSMRIQEIRLVEWLVLIISVPVLSSDDVSVLVILSLPGRLVEQLGICLEATCNRAVSVALSHLVIEFNFSHWHFYVCIGLCSAVRLQVGLSESRTPLLIQRRVGLEHRGLAVPSEEAGSSLVETSLVGLEAIFKAN